MLSSCTYHLVAAHPIEDHNPAWEGKYKQTGISQLKHMSSCSKLTSTNTIFTGVRYLLGLSYHLSAASKGEWKVGRERKGVTEAQSEINIQHTKWKEFNLEIN